MENLVNAGVATEGNAVNENVVNGNESKNVNEMENPVSVVNENVENVNVVNEPKKESVMEKSNDASAATKEKEMMNVEIKLPNGELRKPAFSDFNRDIDEVSVNTLLGKLLLVDYRDDEPIKIIAAEDAKRVIFDINKNPILEQDWKEYFLILDGQHRTHAVSSYNKLNPEKTIQIPGIIPTFKNGESIEQYICDINVAKKPWVLTNFLKSAASINTDNEILKKYQELITTPNNPKGYSISTLNLIYTGKKSGLVMNDFQLICLGKTEKGKKKVKNIIPEELDFENGNAFIDVCLEVGFEHHEIGKRYLIEKFNEVMAAYGSREKALKIFKSISTNDIKAMKNKYGNLVEAAVKLQIEIVKARYTDEPAIAA